MALIPPQQKSLSEQRGKVVYQDKLDFRWIVLQQFERTNNISSLYHDTKQYVDSAATFCRTLKAYGEDKFLEEVEAVEFKYNEIYSKLTNIQKSKELINLQIKAADEMMNVAMKFIHRSDLVGSRTKTESWARNQ